ncbi:uncharacterized [Tachysurus ichikawai]
MAAGSSLLLSTALAKQRTQRREKTRLTRRRHIASARTHTGRQRARAWPEIRGVKPAASQTAQCTSE